MANGPLWDVKVDRRSKFGDPFDWGTVKGAQRCHQMVRQRRKGAEPARRRWRERQEAEQPPQLRWPFRVLQALANMLFRH